jgi:hypothetical protein
MYSILLKTRKTYLVISVQVGRVRFTLGSLKHKMESYMLINLIFLCVVNGLFTFAGIFLNSMVIISLWKSPQLRRGNCHFMIFLLSCFDLLAIIVAHPTIILLSVAWAFEKNTVSQIGRILKEIYLILQILEVCVLFSMNLDRYLAVAHPFFYQARITKGRILKFMIFTQLIFIVVPLMRRISYMKKLIYIIGPIIIALILCTICYMNYKIFVIARDKRRATHYSTIEFNRNSTCVWVIACFLICTVPVIVFGAFKFGASNVIQNENFWTTFRLWSSTIATMNCTFNCIILFWRNRFLRRKVN